MGGTFPASLPIKVQIAWGSSPDSDPATWVWTDATPAAFTSAEQTPSVVITRGTSSEGGALEPAQCTFTLDNHTGDYTPDNPRSRFYPKVKINTPVRVLIDDAAMGQTGLALPGTSWAGVAYTNPTAALNVTALDLRVDIEPQTWRPAQDRIIAAKWDPNSPTSQSWALTLWQTGQLEYVAIDNAGTVFRARSNAIPADAGRLTVAVQHDTATGTVTFSTGPSPATADLTVNRVVTGQATSLHTSSFALSVGSIGVDMDPLRSKAHRFYPFAGIIYTAELRNGAGGALVASPNFTTAPTGVTTLTDRQGNTWLLQASARITDPRVRFVGIISELAPAWPYGDLDTDTDDGESTVAVTATGEIRRQTAKGGVFSSALRRGFGDIRYRSDIVAYWPCEDGELSTTAASGFGGSRYKPLVPSATAPAFAQYGEAIASGPIPTHSGANIGLAQVVPSYTQYGIGYLRVMAYVNVPSTGAGGTGSQVLRLLCGGSLTAWAVEINSAGSLRMLAVDADNNLVVNTGFIGFNLNGKRGALWLYLYGINNGQNMKAQVGFASDAYGAGVGVYEVQAPTGHWFSNATAVGTGGTGDLNGMAIGHLSVIRTDQFWDVLNWVRAWAGETATARMRRLAAEQGHGFYTDAIDATSAKVGPQRSQSYVDLMADAAEADGGILLEPRDAFGLAYRARTTLFNQDPALSLDAKRAGGGDLATAVQPVADDSGMANDVTYTRTDGSSVRVTDPKHIAANGTYAAETTVNVAADAQLVDMANWALHLGTWPGMHYTSVAPALTTQPDLIPAWITTDVGDRIVVANLPHQHNPDPIDLQLAGYTETLTPTTWDVAANTTPGAPWGSVAFLAPDDDTSQADPNRVDTEGSALVTAVDATATTLAVTTTVGTIGWTTRTTDWPFQITVGGERMRVTAVTGPLTGQQVMTVQRGVGGLALPHSAGTPVALAQPAYVAW